MSVLTPAARRVLSVLCVLVAAVSLVPLAVGRLGVHDAWDAVSVPDAGLASAAGCALVFGLVFLGVAVQWLAGGRVQRWVVVVGAAFALTSGVSRLWWNLWVAGVGWEPTAAAWAGVVLPVAAALVVSAPGAWARPGAGGQYRGVSS